MSKQVARPPVSGSDSKRMSGELFTLTYGALVAQLISDYDDDDAVNNQLDKIGYNMGVRMVDDFLSKNQTVGKCHDLREVADVLAKSYMGITPAVANWSPAGDEFSLVLDSNPLTEFVELPANGKHSKLNYSQVICGAIRGALEMVHIDADVRCVQDALRADPTTEIRVKFVRRLQESIPAGDD